jgi:hypothetical protein
MATRRIISNEKTILDRDDPPTDPALDVSTSVPSHVVAKLLGFTAAMIVVPIGSFFLTLNTIFQGNTTFAGALAAVMANVVLISYIFVAMTEDTGEPKKDAPSETKKSL